MTGEAGCREQLVKGDSGVQGRRCGALSEQSFPPACMHPWEKKESKQCLGGFENTFATCVLLQGWLQETEQAQKSFHEGGDAGR